MAYSRPSATNSKLPNCRISPCGSSYSREQGGNDGNFAIGYSGMKITHDAPLPGAPTVGVLRTGGVPGTGNKIYTMPCAPIQWRAREGHRGFILVQATNGPTSSCRWFLYFLAPIAVLVVGGTSTGERGRGSQVSLIVEIVGEWCDVVARRIL